MERGGGEKKNDIIKIALLFNVCFNLFIFERDENNFKRVLFLNFLLSLSLPTIAVKYFFIVKIDNFSIMVYKI